VQAARNETNAADYVLKSQRSATILETSLTYIQLTRIEDKLRWLEKEAQDAQQAETISRDRLREGVDSKLDVTRAELTGARVRMRMAEARGAADLLRQRLAQLTGVDARELSIDGGTIPAEPEVSQQDDYVERALQNSPLVKATEQRARAREQRARGEHNQLYPAVDLVGSYGLFTKYNNMDMLFPAGKFSRNNATFGISIRFPFFNGPQRARAAAALADSLRADKELQAAREQVANDTLQLQRKLQQLAAARDVARLEYELAAADLEAAPERIQTGAATIKDEQNLRIAASEKQAALIDAQIELDRACLQLLRQTDDLERWALP
jgi:outer membrane protein